MAIDSASKRASIMAFADGALLPVPDGTIAAEDRLTLLWLYSGIAAGDVVIPPEPEPDADPYPYPNKFVFDDYGFIPKRRMLRS